MFFLFEEFTTTQKTLTKMVCELRLVCEWCHSGVFFYLRCSTQRKNARSVTLVVIDTTQKAACERPPGREVCEPMMGVNYASFLVVEL